MNSAPGISGDFNAMLDELTEAEAHMVFVHLAQKWGFTTVGISYEPREKVLVASTQVAPATRDDVIRCGLAYDDRARIVMTGWADKIKAIKVIRELRPELGLADAKKFVESVPVAVADNFDDTIALSAIKATAVKLLEHGVEFQIVNPFWTPSDHGYHAVA